MEKLLWVLALTMGSFGLAAQDRGAVLEDAIYLLLRTGDTEAEINPLAPNERVISFDQEFIDKTDQEPLFLVIDAQEFVSLKLREAPTTEAQPDGRKKLLMTLTDAAKAQLEEFTTRHLNEMTAIVVNGKALTKHRVKAVIDSGHMQITRCTDNACEMLFVELQDNVVTE